MAVGDLKYFGMLKTTLSTGATKYYGYDNYQYTTLLDYDTLSTFTYVTATSAVDSPLEWVECEYNGQVCYIAINPIINYIRYAEAIAEQKTCTIDGQKYELKVMPIDFWTGLPSKVVTPLKSFIAWTTTEGKNNVINATYMKCASTDYNTDKVDVTEGNVALSSPNISFVPVLVAQNAAPTISGTDASLGDKTAAFSVSYSVSDSDTGQELTVKEKINGVTIRTLRNPTQGTTLTCSITEELFATLAVGTTNAIEIEATDGSAISYRRYTFVKTNSAPFISYTGDYDLGSLTQKPVITYRVKDNEADTITVTEKLNGTVMNTFTASTDTDYTVNLTDLFWYTCGPATNTVEIIASDTSGGSSSEMITFARQVNKVQIVTANALETDAMSTRVFISPQWTTENCTCTAEACNNGFDAFPTWEDATTMVMEGRPYVFTNTSKTASKWGIKIRLTVVKNEGYTGEAAIYGFGGAYE